MLQIERLPKINVDSIHSDSSMSLSDERTPPATPLYCALLQIELELGLALTSASAKVKVSVRFAIVSMRIVIIKFVVI